MSTTWPKVKLGKVLKPVSREERVDPTGTYRLLGIRLEGRGAFLRETILGSQTAANRLYRVNKGDYIYSRLFACRGAFGIISDALDGCYVSGEFPTFLPIPDQLDIRYLLYWFQLPTVLARVNEDCTGSTPLTRNRFKEKFFLELEIPLPPLSEQERIVLRIEELAEQIGKTRERYKGVDAEIRAMLFAAYKRIAETAVFTPMFSVAPLTRRPVDVDRTKVYPQVAVRSFGKGTFHRTPLRGDEVTWQKPYLVHTGDILISNIKAWEGAIAVAAPADNDHVGSHRYLTCVPEPGVATARFVCFHLLTPEGLHAVGEASPGSADRNRTLSTKNLMQIPIPVPNYKDQLKFDALCEQVDAMKHLQADTATEVDALLPSILDKAFKGEL